MTIFFPPVCILNLRYFLKILFIFKAELERGTQWTEVTGLLPRQPQWQGWSRAKPLATASSGSSVWVVKAQVLDHYWETASEKCFSWNWTGTQMGCWCHRQQPNCCATTLVPKFIIPKDVTQGFSIHKFAQTSLFNLRTFFITPP